MQDVVDTPLAQVQAMSAQAYFQRLAMLMRDNPPYPADAPMLELLKTIGAGEPLDFSKKYVMHFAKDSDVAVQRPLVHFDDPGQLLHASPSNPSNKFAVLSGDPLEYNPDGSLEIYVQPSSPGAGQEANWLPSPPGGPMNLTIRCYWPEEPMLDGTYKVPPLTRVD